MRLMDTSAWVEWLTGTALGQSFDKDFHSLHECLIPTIIQFELQKWCLRERNEAEADRLAAFTMTGVIADLDTETALLAAELSRLHRLHSTDALIYATASRHRSTLVTCDAHFKQLPGVEYHSK